MDSTDVAASAVANDADDDEEEDDDDEDDDIEAEEEGNGDAATTSASSKSIGYARVHSRQKKTQSASVSSNGIGCHQKGSKED